MTVLLERVTVLLEYLILFIAWMQSICVARFTKKDAHVPTVQFAALYA